MIAPLTDEELLWWEQHAGEYYPEDSLRRLVAEVRRRGKRIQVLQDQVAAHVERIVAQSELLTRRAEKPLSWSKEPPAAGGWYLVKTRLDRQPSPVLLAEMEFWGKPAVSVMANGWKPLSEVRDYQDAEWCGPLPVQE
jgi:hypothetical protein